MVKTVDGDGHCMTFGHQLSINNDVLFQFTHDERHHRMEPYCFLDAHRQVVEFRQIGPDDRY